jgi:hypothetical protein
LGQILSDIWNFSDFWSHCFQRSKKVLIGDTATIRYCRDQLKLPLPVFFPITQRPFLPHPPFCSLIQQGCQMTYFQTKKSDLGKFGRVLQWKMFVFYLAIWSILWLFVTFYGHLVYFMVIWYIFPVFVSCKK